MNLNFRTHESASDEEISFDMEHFNNELDNMKEEATRTSEGGKVILASHWSIMIT